MLLTVSEQELATILAALRFYQRCGQGDPANRSDEIHEIATNCDSVTSLNESDIDELCLKINWEGKHERTVRAIAQED